MKELLLIAPSKEYQKSFESYALAYKEINDDHYYNKYKKALENFDEYINELYSRSERKDFTQGEAAVSTFWLIEEKEVVGVVRVRHEEAEYAGHIGYDISPYYRNRGYGTQILRLALEKAAIIGISEAIVTCDVDNIASRKVIEKNNGRLLGIVFDKEDNEKLYKFNIKTIIK